MSNGFFLRFDFFDDWLLHISAKYRYGVRNGYTHITCQSISNEVDPVQYSYRTKPQSRICIALSLIKSV